MRIKFKKKYWRRLDECRNHVARLEYGYGTAGFDLGSLGPQASLEPPLLVNVQFFMLRFQ